VNGRHDSAVNPEERAKIKGIVSPEPQHCHEGKLRMWRYSCTLSRTEQYMQVSCQLQVPSFPSNSERDFHVDLQKKSNAHEDLMSHLLYLYIQQLKGKVVRVL
jgi:hypothetical protein